MTLPNALRLAIGALREKVRACDRADFEERARLLDAIALLENIPSE
jgi:hypothetical protein